MIKPLTAQLRAANYQLAGECENVSQRYWSSSANGVRAIKLFPIVGSYRRLRKPMAKIAKSENRATQVPISKAGKTKQELPVDLQMQIPKEGIHRTMFPNGSPSEEYTIRNGKPHGIWRSWHDNGQVKYEYSFVDGQMTGRMRLWEKDGMLYPPRYFFNGRPISKKGYLAQCEKNPGLPRFEEEKANHTFGNYLRQLRRTKREQAKFGPTAADLEEQRRFDVECKVETKKKSSAELLAWFKNAARQERELGELSTKEALSLARRLSALGASKIWVANIERDVDGGEYSIRLIVTLPDEAAKRGKIYELCVNYARPGFGGAGPAIRMGKSCLRMYVV